MLKKAFNFEGLFLFENGPKKIKKEKLLYSPSSKKIDSFKKEMLKVLSPVIKLIKKLETKNIIK